MAHKYKLSYFNLTGLGEPIRFLLSYGGAKFEDHRFNHDQWPALKNSMPYGKVPVLEIDGKAVHQHLAICRYLAKQFKLTGGSDWDDLQCDMIVDTVNDLRTQVVALFREKDEKKKEEMTKTLKSETIPYYLSRLDAEVKKNSGHFVNGKLTWADLYIVAVLQFLQAFMKMDFMDGNRNLKAINDKVMNIPSIKSWVEKRPKTDLVQFELFSSPPPFSFGFKTPANICYHININRLGDPSNTEKYPFVSTAMAPKYKLTYFDAAGLAEPIRFLFAYGGADYEDVRFQRDEWPQLKDTTPFGHVPILEVDGKTVHQSVAICRYLAKQFNLAGADDWESLQCDMMIDTFSDLRDPVNKYFHEPDEDKKAERLKVLKEETFPFYLKKFDEEVAKNKGYFVGGKLTWCDLYIVSLLQVMQDHMKMDSFGDEYPHLKKVYNTVLDIPSIKSWVERRPKAKH
ncbi:uncharacterized protein [Hetaerina americana]|uniref:uncharacterized protein n=1 Tax=Hetaerina americana TaxID=62018 RepID=UPI003A7F5F1A